MVELRESAESPRDGPASGGRTLLEDLSHELDRIAAMLAHLAALDAVRREAAARPDAERERARALRRVEAVIAARHARSAVFGLDLNNPGWSLLLELWRARLQDRRPSAAQLATAARLSMPTLARWQRRLIAAGHAARRGAAGRGLALTDAGADAMADYFNAVAVGFD